MVRFSPAAGIGGLHFETQIVDFGIKSKIKTVGSFLCDKMAILLHKKT